MAEYVRSVEIRAEIDSNKATYTGRFTDPAEF